MNLFHSKLIRQYSFSVFTFSTLLFFSLFIPAFAAKPVKPPIEEFYKERYIIAEFKAKAQKDNGDVTLEKVSDIWGDAKDIEVLNFPKRESIRVQLGKPYIVVYSYLRKHLLYRDVIEENPEGPTIVNGLAGAAIYQSNKDLKYLFEASQKRKVDGGGSDASRVIDALFGQLLSTGRIRERRLAAFQFMLSSDLHRQLSEEQVKVYRDILNARVLPNLEQELLLTAARALPENQRNEWLVKLCRQTVDESGVEYDLTSLVPIKVRTCVRVIGDYVDDQDTKRLTALLYSNAPGVSKAALRALVSWDSQQAVDVFRQVLDGEKPLHKETHRVLVARIHK